jgi:hypothetical protein
MTNEEPPGRWRRDSPEEDAEAHRARELARLDRWAAEQRLRPFKDALTSHGIEEGEAPGYAGPLTTPEWWDEIPAPAHPCPWCQREVSASPCPECRAARAEIPEPAVWAWWASLTPPRRRLNIAAAYRVDPWSGRRCVIYLDWITEGAEGLDAARLPYAGAAPRGIYWGARAAGG